MTNYEKGCALVVLPQRHHHDITIFLLVMGGSLLLYALFGFGPGLFLPEPKLWAPVDFTNGHWEQWFMASDAIFSKGADVAFDAAMWLGGPTYFGLLWLINSALSRTYDRVGPFNRVAMIIFVYVVWPVVLYEAVYTGLSLGYWMR